MKKFFLSIFVIGFMCSIFVACGSTGGSGSLSKSSITREYYSGDGLKEKVEWKRCNDCDGKGTCKPCRGTGKISGDQCRKCDGTGRCRTCKGQGGFEVGY